jgi:hypothetical protein
MLCCRGPDEDPQGKEFAATDTYREKLGGKAKPKVGTLSLVTSFRVELRTTHRPTFSIAPTSVDSSSKHQKTTPSSISC